MTEKCSYFNEFLESERSALKKELIKHQEELSKKLKKQIARREAELDFIEKKIWAFCKDFRRDYCKNCPGRDKCDLVKLRLKKMRTVKRVTKLSTTVRSSLRGRKPKMKVARKRSSK